MKRYEFKSNLFKSIIVMLFVLVVTSVTFAQTRPPQNIRRVTVTNQYVLENGQKTNKIWAVYQEIYDSLGRLHTEIAYDINDHYPHNYKWHTYAGMQKIKTEVYENEKLKAIKEYKYSQDSLLLREIIRVVKPGDTSLYLTLNFKYNPQRKPVQIEAKTPIGKIAYTTMFTYDSKGTELSRRVKVKSEITPFDSILIMNCKPHYDSVGRLISNLINVTKCNKKREILDIKYTHDKNNNTTGISIRNEKGKLISREERIFQEDKRKRIQQIKYYDSNDNLIKWLAMRYEIYRTADLRLREIEY